MQFDYKRLVKFEHNIGTKEKKVRLYAGLVLLFVSLIPGSVPLLLIGGVLVATSFFGWCPAYSGFNRSTLTAEEASALAEAASNKQADHH